MNASEYLAAFMGGFEFVLRGFEGRLHGADLDEEAVAEIRAFIDDYRRLLQHYEAGRATDTDLRALVATAPHFN